ncbi:hypothetical protein ACFSJU_10310 [Paradesertivirga mongoliensis]|uniref:Uncharacterized protein n=1 Tax=Paradesertivirga mongoliensis TaxID=2100740 RepID=A0ABW4ZLJ4_9SPHI|nr:hypothetical protein [Pedobacter mongoliensis]
MGTYLTFYRLHRLSFIASSLLALLVYTETGYASLAILTKVIVLAALIFLFIPSIKKNSAYFQNLGFSVRKILLCVSIIDFLVLTTFIISIKFVKNYA